VVSYLPPADRALDVLAPVIIYCPVGRRLSDIYVDDTMRPARSGVPAQRLSDAVYWRTHAVPGEQIQERSGETMLVTQAGAFRPIRLSAPQPLQPETAFTHTERAIQADHAILQDLLAQGVLAERPSRRPRGPVARWPDQLLPEGHPLVIDELPAELACQAKPDCPDPARRPMRNRSLGWRMLRRSSC
jgi:hypothetical protein